MFLTAWIEFTGFDQTINFLLQVDVGEVAVKITEIVKAEVDIFDIPSASQDVLTTRIKSTWYDQTTILFFNCSLLLVKLELKFQKPSKMK